MDKYKGVIGGHGQGGIIGEHGQGGIIGGQGGNGRGPYGCGQYGGK